MLEAYFTDYAEIARRAGAGLVLAAPTWRASPDWGARVGYDAADLGRVNRDAVALLHELRERCPDLTDVLVSGVVGPRGDGYVPGAQMSPEEAADYHRPQVDALAAAGADVVEAITMTTAAEAAGVVQAANAAGVPVGVMFTVETDGTLPDGASLREAVERVDGEGVVAYFGVNCAHPDHIAPGLVDGPWLQRITELRPNASTLTHAELDLMEELDEGDVTRLSRGVGELRARLPQVSVVGGCCGTDARHVAALWSVG